MEGDITTDGLEALGMEDIDFNISFSDKLVQAMTWGDGNQEGSNTWACGTPGQDPENPVGNSSYEFHLNNDEYENLCDKSSIDIETGKKSSDSEEIAKLIDAFTEEIAGKSTNGEGIDNLIDAFNEEVARKSTGEEILKVSDAFSEEIPGKFNDVLEIGKLSDAFSKEIPGKSNDGGEIGKLSDAFSEEIAGKSNDVLEIGKLSDAFSKEIAGKSNDGEEIGKLSDSFSEEIVGKSTDSEAIDKLIDVYSQEIVEKSTDSEEIAKLIDAFSEEIVGKSSASEEITKLNETLSEEIVDKSNVGSEGIDKLSKSVNKSQLGDSNYAQYAGIDDWEELPEVSSKTDTNERAGSCIGAKRKRTPSPGIRESTGLVKETSTQSKRTCAAGPSAGQDSPSVTTQNKNIDPNQEDSDDESSSPGSRVQSTLTAELSCPHGCFKVISAEIFKKIYDHFCTLNRCKQDYLMASLMNTKRIAVDDSEKQVVVHKLKQGPTAWVVCRKAFLHAFKVTEARLRDVYYTLVKKQEERFQVMKEHFANFVTLVPLNRSSVQRLYYSPDLNLERLYALYVEFAEQQDLVETVSKECYQRIFQRYSTVRLVSSKHDRCTLCETLNRNVHKFSGLPNQAVPLAEAWTNLKMHDFLATEDEEIIRCIPKRKGIENTLILYISKQQAYPIPKIPSSLNYCKRKLWAYYLCVRNLKKRGMTKVYVWDEVTAKRGSTEVISCLGKWIEESHDREDNLVVFTDSIGNCRNINMFLFHLRLIHSKRFLKIEHYFLVPGNHANPCNRILSEIESALDRQSAIVSKEDFMEHIRDTASEWDSDVVAMERNDFLDYSVLQSYIQEGSNDGMTFRNARVVTINCCYKEGYHVTGTSRKVKASKPVRLMPGTSPFTLKKFNLAAVEIPQKYPRPVCLNPQKLADLRDLLHCIVPYKKRNYLRRIFVDQDSLEEESVVGDPIVEEEEDEAEGLYEYV
ncbi:uncharacterized protein [Palaemon carinicauda]|uniref:uncharacterized protein n=1 Tax=Palaemon carinicauda TaxID=392227 RepID=UPI0035B58C25